MRNSEFSEQIHWQPKDFQNERSKARYAKACKTHQANQKTPTKKEKNEVSPQRSAVQNRRPTVWERAPMKASFSTPRLCLLTAAGVMLMIAATQAATVAVTNTNNGLIGSLR